VLQNQHTNTVVQENIIELTLCAYKMALKCQNIAKKVAKITSKVEPPSTKMLLNQVSQLLGLM